MLEVKDLMVFYENALAVNNVSMQCDQGAITGVFGPNNAGKSTLTYTLSGIILDMKKKEEMKGGLRITVLGKIKFMDKDISNVKPHKRAKMGIVLCPERRQIFQESTTLENLKIGGHLASKEQAKKTLEYVFELFPLLKRLKRRQAGFLSGGEQQMLAIGRALMAQPKLLILDEPLMGLSPVVIPTLTSAIEDIKKQTGVTLIITEQYAEPILPIIDYGYVLENGGAVLDGAPQELLDNPDVRAAYLGI
jgi:branched-chain amino acid transport system ATP-binding protein